MLRVNFANEPQDVVLLEMQGTLTITSHGESSTSSGDEVTVGFIRTTDPAKPKKCTLHIGTQVIEGESSQLKRPVVVVRKSTHDEQSVSRKRPRDAPGMSLVLFEDWIVNELHNDDEVDTAVRSSGEYEVVGIARQHFLFSGKPMRIFGKKP